MDRRGFIKGAVATATGGLSGLLKAIGLADFIPAVVTYMKSGVDEEMEWALRSLATSSRTNAANLEDDNIPSPDAVRGYLAFNAVNNPANVIAWATQEEGGIDKYIGGSMGDILNGAVRSIGGAKQAINALKTTIGTKPEAADSLLYAVQALQYGSPIARQFIGDIDIESARSDERLARRIFHKIGFSKQELDDYVKHEQEWRQEREEHDQARASLPLEKIKPSEDDHIRASSMHQPYENKQQFIDHLASIMTEDIRRHNGFVLDD